MAGITDMIPSTSDTSVVDNAAATVSMLDEAKNQARGIQETAIRDLFNYDKSLSDRYSSPGSKMYLENAADRERAISGYSGTATKEINNVFDIMETVRKASDDLKAMLEKNKGSGSGSASPFSLSDLNAWLNADKTPQPPADFLSKYNSDSGILVYKVMPDNTVDWQFKKPYEPVDPSYTLWQPSPDKSNILEETLGLDKATLAQLSAVESMFGEKKANSLLWSYISSGFTKKANQTVDTTSEAVAQIKSFKTREEARQDLEQNRSFLIQNGVDVTRLDREIDIYFDKLEGTAGSAESTKSFLEQLKATRGQ